MYLFVVEGVGCAEVCEAVEQVEGYAPFTGFGDTGYAQGVSAADVADDGLVVREGDDVAGGDDVVHADECGAISIGYDR